MRRVVVAVVGSLAWWIISCREVPAPEEGILSLSPLRLPSPGLVVGDTMRDSLGMVAPLRVVAYGESGDTVAATVQFVVIDTAPGAHLSGAYLIGDKAGTTVRVIASTQAIQTQPASVRVTLSPDTLVATDSVLHRRTYAISAADTTVDASLNTTVLHRSGATATGVEAVVVKYLVEQSPPGIQGAPTVVLLNGSTVSPRDTTDGSGHATRTARLRITAKTSFATDTALISATASYAGRVLGRVLFTLIYTGNP